MDKVKIEKYSEYKDSGVQWIGEIPQHWRIVRIKHLFSEINVRSFDGSEDLLSVSQYTGVTNKTEKLEDGGMLTNAATLEGYKIVSVGDLVSNIMLAWNGSLGISPFNGITSPAYSIYRLKNNDVNRYFHYLLRTELYKSEFKRNSSGVIESRLRLYTDDFFRIESILPPKEEQAAISAFLDRKTALIDQAIDIKQKQIELLKERRQILIHKAVTRGLNPNVKMKDSGVEWIGEIPEGWETKRLTKEVFIQEGPGIMASDFYENGIPLIRISGVKGSYLTLDGCNYLKPAKVNSKWNHFRLEMNDIIISGSASTELVSEVNEATVGCICYTGLIRLKVKSENVIKDYLKIFLGSKLFLTQIDLQKTGSTISHYGPSHLNRMILVLPSLNEQIAITNFINDINRKFELAITLKDKEIEKLKEYKSTLINSAVTGKIKVC